VRVSGPEPGLVVIGASAGGIPALRALVGDLDAELFASVLVVLHLPPSSHSMLPQILSRAGPLASASPQDSERLVSGRIFVAPPDEHLLVDRAQVHLGWGATENGFRPSIDALFRSAAYWYGPRVVGAILSGALDDGSVGLAAVAAAGGVALVQDSAEADVVDMPTNALAMVPDAEVAPVAGIAKRINELAGSGPATELRPVRDELDDGPEAYELRVSGGALISPIDVGADAAGLSCPDCHGSLFALPDATTRFRCHVGHAWTAESLMKANERGLEKALWAALRVLQENQAIDDRLAWRRRPGSFAYRAAQRREQERRRMIETLRSALDRLAPGDEEGS